MALAVYRVRFADMPVDRLGHTVHFKIALWLEIRTLAVQLAKHTAILQLCTSESVDRRSLVCRSVDCRLADRRPRASPRLGGIRGSGCDHEREREEQEELGDIARDCLIAVGVEDGASYRGPPKAAGWEYPKTD